MKKQTKINKIKAKQSQKNTVQVEDQRFKRIHYDPKFTPHSNKLNKVKVDNRFSAMLSDPKFSVANSKDKYGRKITKQQQANAELEQYYYKDEPENQDIEQQQQENQNVSKQNDEENYSQEEAQQEEGQDRLRKWMDEYDQQSSEEELNIQQMAQKGQDKIWSDEQSNVIKNEKVPITKRLALCNYDWMSINAKDLMILFNSFKSKNGYIQSVQVYQSMYGKQKMEQQERQGPKQLLKASEQNMKKNSNNNNKKKFTDLLRQTDDYTKNLNEKQLRAYEKQRLKYFYAIITCDNKKTSQQIYENCDGQQFENSNLSIDLRYVPDDLVIDSGYLRDQCTQLPSSGQVKQVMSRATGHSKVDLTWENPELSQLAKLKKNNWNKMTDQQIDKIDWGLYLNEDDIEDQDDMKQLDRAMQVQQEVTEVGWRNQCNKKFRKKSDDIQITFGSGFQNAAFNKEGKPELKSLNQQKKASMKERRRLKEEKNREKLQLLTDNEKKIEFKPNLQDNRFKAVYQNPLYTIDPVDPKFDHKRAGKVFQQTVKRNRNKQTKSWG